MDNEWGFVPREMELKEADRNRIKRIEHLLEEVVRLLKLIVTGGVNAKSAILLIFTSEERKGKVIRTMPAKLQVGRTASSVFTEFDGPNGTGNVVQPSGPISFVSDHPEIATVDSSGKVTAVAANADGSDATATITASDSASQNKVSASDTVTVSAAAPPPPPPGVAQSATLVVSADAPTVTAAANPAHVKPVIQP